MIKAVDRKYEDEHVTLCNYRPRFSLVWLGFTQRPEPVSDDPEDDTYKLAADVKERRKSNPKILDNENTEIGKGKIKAISGRLGTRSRGTPKGKGSRDSFNIC